MLFLMVWPLTKSSKICVKNFDLPQTASLFSKQRFRIGFIIFLPVSPLPSFFFLFFFQQKLIFTKD